MYDLQHRQSDGWNSQKGVKYLTNHIDEHVQHDSKTDCLTDSNASYSITFHRYNCKPIRAKYTTVCYMYVPPVIWQKSRHKDNEEWQLNAADCEDL